MKELDMLMSTDIVRPRRCGYTTTMIDATKKHDGVLVCHNMVFANQLAKEHNIKTAHLNSELRGIQGPIFWDSFALCRIAHSIESEHNNEINKLKQQLKEEQLRHKQTRKELVNALL